MIIVCNRTLLLNSGDQWPVIAGNRLDEPGPMSVFGFNLKIIVKAAEKR